MSDFFIVKFRQSDFYNALFKSCQSQKFLYHKDYLLASSIATATATVIPTIGLLPFVLAMFRCHFVSFIDIPICDFYPSAKDFVLKCNLASLRDFWYHLYRCRQLDGTPSSLLPSQNDDYHKVASVFDCSFVHVLSKGKVLQREHLF